MRRHKGFTLIELLVVIGIIAVLVGILVPVITGAKTSARKTQCAANLRTIGQAVMSYGADNYRKLPVHAAPSKGTTNLWDISRDTRDALLKAGATRSSFYCPLLDSDTDDSGDFGDDGGSDEA